MSNDATSSMNSFSLNHMSSYSDSQHNANVKVTVHLNQAASDTSMSNFGDDISQASLDYRKAHGALDRDGEKVKLRTLQKKNLFSADQ